VNRKLLIFIDIKHVNGIPDGQLGTSGMARSHGDGGHRKTTAPGFSNNNPRISKLDICSSWLLC